MDNLEFPSNSKHAGEKALPPKVIEKVVTGEVVQRKKPLGRRFREMITAREFKEAARYIMSDVLAPAAKNMLVDAVTKGAQRVVYGDTPQSRNRGYSDPRMGRVQYNSPIDRHLSSRRLPADRTAYSRDRKDIGEIVLPTKEDAAIVLERMVDIADQFDIVSVQDLYELLGLQSTHVDTKWGWSGLHDARITQVREGFLIDLPAASPI